MSSLHLQRDPDLFTFLEVSNLNLVTVGQPGKAAATSWPGAQIQDSSGERGCGKGWSPSTPRNKSKNYIVKSESQLLV